MATHYDRGRAFEYKVRDYYRNQGYYVVRSAGSKGKVDLCVIGPGPELIFVQCKAGQIAARERTEAIALAALAATYGATAVLAYRDDKKKMVLETL